MKKTPNGQYKNIDHFLEENTGWISVKNKLPKDGAAVDVLDWMFNNFTMKENVEYVSNGSFIEDIGNNHSWPLKVSHWRYHNILIKKLLGFPLLIEVCYMTPRDHESCLIANDTAIGIARYTEEEGFHNDCVECNKIVMYENDLPINAEKGKILYWSSLGVIQRFCISSEILKEEKIDKCAKCGKSFEQYCSISYIRDNKGDNKHLCSHCCTLFNKEYTGLVKGFLGV